MAELGTGLPEELREQQRAMGAVLRAAASGRGLQPVLDEVAAASMRLCRADTSSLYVLDGALLHAVARAGGDLATWEYDQAHPHELDGTTVVGRAALARGPAHIPDVLHDSEYTYGGPRLGYRSLLGVPIIFEDELIGGMTLTREEPASFTDEQIELVQTFADQAAIAIKNARLLETVERQLSQQRSVSGVMRSVARSHGLQAVLDDIVRSATLLSGVENGRLFLLRDGFLYAVANSGTDENFEYDRHHAHTIDRSTMTGRAALTREPVHIPDVLEDPEYTYAGDGSDLPYRSGVTVPILLDEELIGAFGIVSEETHAFTDEHIQLLQTFADQAAIAIANARLIDAVERQLEQQRAIGDVLGVVARSEGLEAVFDIVADSATRLCHGDYGALYLKEGDVLVVAAQRYGRPDTLQFEQEHPHAIDRSTAIGRAAVTRDVVHIPDTHEDPEYSWGAAGIMEYRSLLAAPILLEGELIGAMNVVKVAAEPFAPEDTELIRTFADQAAIAIANARLIDAVRRQLEQQKAIGDVLGVVARGEGLDSVFDAVVEAAARLCDAEYGQICIADGDVLRLAGTHGTPPEVVEYERAHPSPRDRSTVVGRVAVSSDVVHIPDVLDDPEYSWAGQPAGGYRAMLGVPIYVEGELTGVINVVRNEPVPFTDEQIDLTKTFADQAAIAIANARLIEAVEHQLEQQKAIADVLRAIALSEGLENVFQSLVAASTRLSRGDFGGLWLVDENGFFRIASRHEWDPALDEYDRTHPITADRTTAVGRAGLTRAVVHIPDVEADPEYAYRGREVVDFRAVLAAPVLIEEELIGVIFAGRYEPGPFPEEGLRLIRAFADQAAIAIARARLIEAVERQRSELARFVSPQVAELVSSDEGERMLAGHRAYVTSMFCDLRGFTSFTELAEPEELFEVLREYHLALGELIPRYEGTLEHFAGDGLMVFFNDPVPVDEHELKSVQLALAAQERFEELASTWRKRGHELGLGIGIAAGYATLGRIGFEGRYDYGVLGTVTNLASRLSTQAEPGQTLISQRVFAAVEERVDAHEVGALELKGFGRPVPAYEVRRLKT